MPLPQPAPGRWEALCGHHGKGSGCVLARRFSHFIFILGNEPACPCEWPQRLPSHHPMLTLPSSLPASLLPSGLDF